MKTRKIMKAKNFRGYIASNQYTPAFFVVDCNTAKGCIISLKRRFPEWPDLCLWVEDQNGNKVINLKP